MSPRITVYLVGVTGRTGTSIADALLNKPDQFKLVASVRPSSSSKPAVASFRERGTDIHIVDLASLSHEELVSEIRSSHANVLISTVVPAYPAEVQLQKALAQAAKEAGVQRFVPSDWASACPPGVMRLQDNKYDVHAYIKEIGLGYTFINVGLWFQLFQSIGSPKTDHSETFHILYGSGDVKCAVTDRRDVGEFVARIIADERTLNHSVFVWGEEITLNEIYALGEKIYGKKVDPPPPHISAEEIEQKLKNLEGIQLLLNEYFRSTWVRGDNTLENAKRPEYGGALDARELYPDIKVRTLEQVMREVAAST